MDFFAAAMIVTVFDLKSNDAKGLVETVWWCAS